MKRLLLWCTAICFTSSVFSQTIVSTSPENRSVILEEFTGVNCGFCPDGHAIANSIKANYPDDFFIINVHAGGFANPGPGQPDFRTVFGDAIDAQALASGYPAGSISRTVFPAYSQNPGGTAMGRGSWANATNQLVTQSSYLNVGVEAEINTDTNIITVHVEAYYTGNSPVSSNKLNIALLQNNTLGPQSGGGMGNSYPHMHRLVHMLTGIWGDDITTTTQGTFIDRTYSYIIPSDYNGISADVNTADFEVVAFIAEGQQNIISGDGAVATFTSGLLNNDVMLNSIEEPGIICSGELSPKVEIYNIGTSTLSSLDFSYSVNGESPQNFTWTGSLPSLGITEIELSEIQFNVQDSNEVVVTLSNDDDNINNSKSIGFSYTNETYVTSSVNLSISFDSYPQETTWEILDSSGGEVHSGGPYNGQAGQTLSLNNLGLADDDCYTFNIYDAYGDGICCGWGSGSYSLTTSNGDVILSGGNFDSSESSTFSNYVVLSSSEFGLNNLKIYPNPSDGVINITGNDISKYEVFDIQGRRVASGNFESSSHPLNLSNLRGGVYLIKVFDNNNYSKTQKVILK
jgi:hypothetical protein